MAKVQMGPGTFIYPMPTLLVGANVDGKPNFMTVAWGNIANAEPPMATVAIRSSRHTHIGIEQNRTFSINIPSADLLKEADYCGIASGAGVNKVQACHFTVFYGKLGTAPMIEQCPINLECRVMHSLELGSHTLYVGRIDEVHASSDCFTDGRLDLDKVKPLVFLQEPLRQYHAVGQFQGKAFSIGLEIKGQEPSG
ncbi:MAG TPA: flavin reductase family protein [Dehalococcoidia bacterium]|nr:flavin reductase family protein [Dehalococcoidia bacterium]